MNKKAIEIIKDLLVLILLVSFWITIYHVTKLTQPDPAKEGYIETEYCLEWGNKYDRNSLMLLCVNFAEETLDCEWQIQPDNSMLVWTDENNSVLLNCTKKVMALERLN